MGRKVGAAVLLSGWGEVSSNLTQCGLSRGSYLGAEWHLDPPSRLATIHQRHRETGGQDRQTTVR